MIQQTLVAQGIPVEIHFYRPDLPVVTFGKFQLENSGANSLEISIKQAACRFGDEQTAVAEHFLYLLPEYEEQSVDCIMLAPYSKSVFEISFAAVNVSDSQLLNIAVVISLCAGDAEIDIESQVAISMRTRRG